MGVATKGSSTHKNDGLTKSGQNRCSTAGEMGNRRTAAHNYQPPLGTTSDYALALALLASSFTSCGGTDTMGVPPHNISGRMAWSDTLPADDSEDNSSNADDNVEGSSVGDNDNDEEGGNRHHHCHPRLQNRRPTVDGMEPSNPAPTTVSEAHYRKKSNRPVNRRPPGSTGNLAPGLSLRQVDCGESQENSCFKDSGADRTGSQEIRMLHPEAAAFTPASIKSRVPTSTATLPQGSGMNTWSEAVIVNNEEG